MEIKDLINDNVAFHCDTKEKAVEFLHKAHALGYMWRYIDEDSNYKVLQTTVYHQKSNTHTYYNSGDRLYLLPPPATFPCALLHRRH